MPQHTIRKGGSLIHLHTHSHYSTLDGLGKPREIVEKAVAMSATAVAISDHASISSMIDLFKECKQAGIKPIIGCEFYFVDAIEEVMKDKRRYHFSAWAKNWNGVQSIMKQLTIANDQFYRRPILTENQLFAFEDCCVGTACSGGALAKENWEELTLNLHERYGDDLYLEIMPFAFPDDEKGCFQQVANARAIQLNERFGIKLLATNDAHYVNEQDADTHEILLAIQSGKTWNDPKRWSLSGGKWYYMRNIKEMIEAFKTHCSYVSDENISNSILNTKELADKVDVQMPEFKVTLPSLHENDDATFSKSLTDGWRELIAGKFTDEKIQTYADRLKYEIGVIKKLDFVKYFLIVEDIIRFSHEQGIMVGPARGSSAGSLICYLMGITQVDPIQHGLIFERFLNPERIDLPDIDIDFQDDRRQEVFDYIQNKYGHDKTSHINTFGKMTIKSAFRDVSRVFGIQPVQVNALSKLIEDTDSFESVPELAKFQRQFPIIVDETKKLTGTIRQSGVHACGMVISSHSLTETSVIEKRKDKKVVNWEMANCEPFGMLKVDILGLSTLTVIEKCLGLIKQRHGIEVDLNEIPLTDKKTLESFTRGEGLMVFQFENPGMQSLLRSIKAGDFETITATTALFRPGSLQSGETARYVAITKGDEYEEYLCPEIEPILKPTKGVMVYQEQIMRIFSELGGFTIAEADKMRKIIGKKLGKDEFNKHKEHFVEGCTEKNIDKLVSADLFDGMAEFAAYSFNKSHAVAYTLLSFWTMYLKVNYPIEFVASYLDVTKDDKAGEIVREAEKLKIKVRQPDVNLSSDKYIIDANEIVAPLTIIKGVGSKAVEAIMKVRKDGVFLSIDDMEERLKKAKLKRAVHKGIIEKLTRAGVFESFGIRETNSEQRIKDFSELLPIFVQLPTIHLGSGEWDQSRWSEVAREYLGCSKANKKQLIEPVFTKNKSSIMVINNALTGEKSHFTKSGSKYFKETMKGMGLNAKHYYYTSPIKCIFEYGKKPPKECQANCNEFLKKEIQAIKPKLIICFATQTFNSLTTTAKPIASKMNGKIEYNKEFDCYVFFSYSPQYAAYKGGDIDEKFKENMKKLSEMLI